jgi:DNA-binding response OmpR family regulator
LNKLVMIVEDELFVALDLESIVESAGFGADGPYETVADALAAVESQLPNCAILDVRLPDGEVFPAADRLRDAGVPLIFHSGHADHRELLSRYPGAQICPKPSSPSSLRTALRTALGCAA